MRKRPLGKTGLSVTEVSMGCWELSGVSRGGGSGFGEQDDMYSVKLIRRALDRGVNFFDTADAYGLGHSEVVLGRALRESGQRPIVATKVGNNFYVQPWQKGFNLPYIENAVENSLQRLGLDCIDLYQLHNPPLEVIEKGEAFEALERLKEAGKIRFYGISLNTPEEGFASMRVAPGLSAIMTSYNIIEQENASFFEEAKQKGIAIISRSPLASGRLTGAMTRDMKFSDGDYRGTLGAQWLEDAVSSAENLRFLVKGDTRSLAQAALKFALAHDAVSVVIPGPKTVEELDDNIQVAESSPLSPEDLQRIKELHEKGAIAGEASRAPLDKR